MDSGQTADASDTEILEWAKQHSAVILTNDLDFGTILAASHLDSPSVFQIRSQILDPRIVGRTVLACFKTFEPDLKAGALVSYEPDRSRVRKLPI